MSLFIGPGGDEELMAGQSSPPNNLQAHNQPVDFLELILTEELLQYIVDQTNLYARPAHGSMRGNLSTSPK